MRGGPFLNSSRRRHDVAPLYDITSRSYDSLYREEQFRKYEFIFEIRGVAPGKTILDLGCGTGLLIEYLMGRSYRFDKYICVEPSIGMISVIIDKGFNKRNYILLPLPEGRYLNGNHIKAKIKILPKIPLLHLAGQEEIGPVRVDVGVGDEASRGGFGHGGPTGEEKAEEDASQGKGDDHQAQS